MIPSEGPETSMNPSNGLKEETFISKDYEFIKTTWNGISVIREKKSGYYYANGMCRTNEKDFDKIASKSYWKRYISKLERRPCLGGAQGTITILNVSNEFRGTYIHELAVNFLCMRINDDYAIDVSILMSLINENNKIKGRSLQEIIQDYEKENKELKSEINLKNVIITEQNKQIDDFNHPNNQSKNPPMIYAYQVNDQCFQLRYKSNPTNDLGIRRVKFPNARDVLFIVKQELIRSKLAKNIKGQIVISVDHIDQVFNLIDDVKGNKGKDLPSAPSRNEYINKKLQTYRSMRQTAMVEGLIYEHEIILSRPSYIPWKLIPMSIKRDEGEQFQDNGIDAVEFNDKKQIKTIIQIKHHRAGYLRRDEIQTFINKCQQERYKTVEKLLIVHGCKVGKKLVSELEAIGIKIEQLD